MEESLCLPELLKILEVQSEKQHRQNKFLAALQNIDLDKKIGKTDNEDSESITENEAAAFGLAFNTEGESVGETETING